jgi:uncharacterized protein YggU (UPF0235/DUF167 family)
MTIELVPGPKGIRFFIKARPGAPSSAIRGVREGRLLVAVTAVAEKGRANQAIIKLLARSLDVAPSQLAIIAGGSGSLKTVELYGLSMDELRRRLDAVTQR